MFEVVVGTLLSVMGTGLLGVGAWLVRLSNKVAVLESERENIKEWIREKFEDMAKRLDRIDQKLDHKEAK